MKKHLGVLCGMSLLALCSIEAQAKIEPASAVLLGSVLLAVAATIRHKARKV
jgi:hypothetical protein